MASAGSSIPSILLNVLCFILFVGPLFECIGSCTVLPFLLRAGLRPDLLVQNDDQSPPGVREKGSPAETEKDSI